MGVDLFKVERAASAQLGHEHWPNPYSHENRGTSLIRTGVPRSYERGYLAYKNRGTPLI